MAYTQNPTNQGESGNPFAYNQKNPYLSQMADTIRSQVTDNLQRNILPGIGSGAQLAVVESDEVAAERRPC